jgi:hypothetical protein
MDPMTVDHDEAKYNSGKEITSSEYSEIPGTFMVLGAAGYHRSD